MPLDNYTQNARPGSPSISNLAREGLDKFPNPFCDAASEYIPSDITEIMELAEMTYLSFGTYRQAARRVVRYFLTRLELTGESERERESFEEILSEDVHLLSELASIGDDFMVYGNVFVSIYFPFIRTLTCRGCGTEYKSDLVPYKFNKDGMGQFTGKCPKCGYEGAYVRNERRDPDTSGMRIIRWDPKNIRLQVHDITGETRYYLRLDPQFVRRIREGRQFYLDTTPWPIVECCLREGDGGTPYFGFNKNAIYHMRESTLAGLPIRGWGIPPVLPNFKLAYYIQILRRYDEAIALDYIMPFRILHPQMRSQGSTGAMNPLEGMNMSGFKAAMEGMVQNKRHNPTDVQISPYPIGYEMLGGEAKALAPKESITQAMDELLNATGFPAELYRGSLSIQAFPVALRLFEKTWGTLVDGYNDLINWIVGRMAAHYGYGEVSASLQSVTLADDLERKALTLQAAAGQDISKDTAYRPLGIDFMDEQEKVVEEQREISKLQQEAMEQQQASQMDGEGEQQGGPGGTPAATPGDVHDQAKSMAHELVMQVPASQRRGELIDIKHSNPTLHALVLKYMDELRNELESQGKTMLIQEAKQASAAEKPSPMDIGICVASSVMDTTRADLRKVASDIGRGVDGAGEAFQFLYRRINGGKD